MGSDIRARINQNRPKFRIHVALAAQQQNARIACNRYTNLVRDLKAAAPLKSLFIKKHLEETPESLAELVAACGADLPAPGPWVSTAEQLLSPNAPYDACAELLFGLLDSMAARRSPRPPAPRDRPIPDRTTTEQRELP